MTMSTRLLEWISSFWQQKFSRMPCLYDFKENKCGNVQMIPTKCFQTLLMFVICFFFQKKPSITYKTLQMRVLYTNPCRDIFTEIHEYVLKQGRAIGISNQGDGVRGRGGLDRFPDTFMVRIDRRMPDWEHTCSDTHVAPNRLQNSAHSKQD